GRSAAYQALLDAADLEGLEAALVRNVWRGAAGGQAGRLARLVVAQDAHLGRQGLADLARGEVDFLAPEGVAA
ncbi:MAG: ubiquinol-cytochrome C chaperone, partial [Rhodospirillales bacterium]|nr:ubiquinol-cytochrome C chaperone [Rhodospirillales bacterium]